MAKSPIQVLLEAYEDLQFHFVALEAALLARNDASLLQGYAQVVTDASAKAEMHKQFLPLYTQISKATNDHEVLEALKMLPPIKHRV